jgi:hypothetical protein
MQMPSWKAHVLRVTRFTRFRYPRFRICEACAEEGYKAVTGLGLVRGWQN